MNKLQETTEVVHFKYGTTVSQYLEAFVQLRLGEEIMPYKTSFKCVLCSSVQLQFSHNCI